MAWDNGMLTIVVAYTTTGYKARSGEGRRPFGRLCPFPLLPVIECPARPCLESGCDTEQEGRREVLGFKALKQCQVILLGVFRNEIVR
jgi:hypothetical protein